MKNILTQHVNEDYVKTYYLNFDENGDKSQELLDVLMDSLIEFVFGIKYIDIKNPQSNQRFFNACERLYKENRAFNKVMHRKSMFDEGSAKLEAKGKNTSKILPLTRDDEGR